MDAVKREKYALALAYSAWREDFETLPKPGYWAYFDKERERYLRMAEDFEKLVDAATQGGIKL